MATLAQPEARSCPENYCRRRVYCTTLMGLPTRLNWSRQWLQYRQHWRSLSLVCGAGAQDVCAITLFRSRWTLNPSLSVLSSSHGRNISGHIRCSSYSSVWKESSSTANASVDSGDTQTIEELWEEYCADPFQWWDNRVDKKNPRSPDMKHKVTRKALWIHGWSTPAWVKARLKPVTQGRLQCHAGNGTKDSQDTTRARRLPIGSNSRRNILPSSARELVQIVEGGGDTKLVRSTGTTNEAVAF